MDLQLSFKYILNVCLIRNLLSNVILVHMTCVIAFFLLKGKSRKSESKQYLQLFYQMENQEKCETKQYLQLSFKYIVKYA